MKVVSSPLVCSRGGTSSTTRSLLSGYAIIFKERWQVCVRDSFTTPALSGIRKRTRAGREHAGVGFLMRAVSLVSLFGFSLRDLKQPACEYVHEHNRLLLP